MKLIKPRPLRRGGKIGVVAPAGCASDDQLRLGVEALRGAGFEVELADGIQDCIGYLAGDKEKRAKALLEFFRRSDIEAIFCSRGGFGSIQLIPLLEPEAIRRHAKIFVGYSDVSILLNWFLQKAGVVTFHGPMVAMDISRGLEGRSREFFWQTLLGEKQSWQLELDETIRSGYGEAAMVGGCLSVIVTTLGTPYEIDTKEKILFLEDIGEKPYRIERMLTHLQMAGKLDGLAGLVFGGFTDCEGEGPRGFQEIVTDFFQNAAFPVAAGLAAGHGEENLLLPFGVKMGLDTTAGSLSLLEPPLE